MALAAALTGGILALSAFAGGFALETNGPRWQFDAGG